MNARLLNPSARLVFTEGNYSNAVAKHFIAHDWIFNSGLRYRGEIDTEIVTRLNGKVMGTNRPPRYLDADTGWQITVEFFYDLQFDQLAKQYLSTLQIPNLCTLEFL